MHQMHGPILLSIAEERFKLGRWYEFVFGLSNGTFVSP
jgi:hypothetical protein